MSRAGPAELALRALGALGPAQVLLGGLLLGGLLLAATGPPRDDPYPLLYGLGTAAVAALGLLLVEAAPAARRWARSARPARTQRDRRPRLRARQPAPAGA